ncbi:hypothetical protein JRO89_XS02G0279800 [Xanthoceras sorbifolium]|uniref:Uncharacterized protein n=1 Tax=Xanthoceras sorbifolium TaxID=99658 RepID=A0ABQ8IHA6_9ROSI|nr:hypothetical protein JRO89_XS02G0279800 [Xanthoceras sorbifolium]
MRTTGPTDAFFTSKFLGTLGIKTIMPSTFCGQVESGDLIAYGLIPEFVGQFPNLVSMSEDQFVQVCSFF